MEFWQPMFVGEVSVLEATVSFASKRSLEVTTTVKETPPPPPREKLTVTLTLTLTLI